jgi:membrane associated rhomboid family serine protease
VVFPLRDDNPVRITPYVTYGLIALNVLIFLYELTLSPIELMTFFRTWAVVPEQLSASFQSDWSIFVAHEWFTLISSQFLHAGFLHVGGNMLYLWIFGNNVEEQLGRGRFLLFYLACGHPGHPDPVVFQHGLGGAIPGGERGDRGGDGGLHFSLP